MGADNVEDIDWLRSVLPDLLAIATVVAGHAEDGGADGSCVGCGVRRKQGEAHKADCVWLKAKAVVSSAARRQK